MDVFGNERITLIDFTSVLFPGEEHVSFLLFWGVGKVLCNAINTAGCSDIAQSLQRLDALANITIDHCGILTLNFMTSLAPLPTRLWCITNGHFI